MADQKKAGPPAVAAGTKPVVKAAPVKPSAPTPKPPAVPVKPPLPAVKLPAAAVKPPATAAKPPAPVKAKVATPARHIPDPIGATAAMVDLIEGPAHTNGQVAVEEDEDEDTADLDAVAAQPSSSPAAPIPLSALPENTELLHPTARFWWRALTNNMRGRVTLGIAFVAGLMATGYLFIYLSGNQLYIGIGVAWVVTFWAAGTSAGKNATRLVLMATTDPEGARHTEWNRWWRWDEVRWPSAFRVMFQHEDELGEVRGKPEMILALDATESTVESFYDNVWRAPTGTLLARDRGGQMVKVPTSADMMIAPLLEASFQKLLSIMASRKHGAKLMTYLLIIGASLIVMYFLSGQFAKARFQYELQRGATNAAAAAAPAQGVAQPTPLPQDPVPAQPVDPAITPR